MNKITYDFRAFNKIKYKKKYLIKFDKIIYRLFCIKFSINFPDP